MGRLTPTSRPAAEVGASAPLPQGAAKVQAVRAMFDSIAPRYDLVNRVMTFGMDRGWRRQAVRSLRLAPGGVVLDLACGTGELCRDLEAQRYRPIGVDLSFGMLANSTATSPLIQGDALRLPLPDACADGATSGFALRNFVELDGFFRELARVVRPRGRIALLDVAQPEHPLLRLGHNVYFGHVVPRIGAALSDAAAYRYLPRSVAYLPPVGDMLDQLRGAGFGAVERRLLSGGITQLFSATRRSP